MFRSCALTALALSSLAFGSAVSAETVSFASLDKNSDGRISLDEASVNDNVFVAFKKLDIDRDGDLTKEEFDAYQEKT